jgi:hypothetical protein
MPDPEKAGDSTVPDILTSRRRGPLVFISHDARDADLAEALSKLLKR